MRVVVAPVLACEERHEDEAEHIVRGEQRRGCAKRPKPRMAEQRQFIKDRVFGEKPSEREETRNGDRADKERPEREWHAPGEPTHLAYVLLATQIVNDDASRHKQQRLEERVRDKMERACGVGSDANGEYHIAD